MSPTQDQFEAELERLGVDEVRARITTNVYQGGQRNHALAWLDKEIDRRADAASLSHSHAARSANKAAWIAAIAALILAIFAMISNVTRDGPTAPPTATH
jgi:hypothetical protein